jgi:hypothetical protein
MARTALVYLCRKVFIPTACRFASRTCSLIA